MAKVELIGLKKYFGHVKAVDGIDLEIKDGEFLALLGPSGSGKTTLMRLFAGLESPTEGSILIDGKNVNDAPPRERGIAMVFQSYALYPHKSVFKNISFPLKVEGLNKEDIKKKVEWAAGLLHIGHLLERMPSQISGGEKQRVAIARALVRRPKVLLMDEPLSNLDAKVRHMAREELKLFQRDIGVTTIYVTHDQAEAMGLGDRIAVMNAGRISQIGAPDEIYNEPSDTFVAGFVGIPPMNFIEKDNVILGFRPETFLPAELINPPISPFSKGGLRGILKGGMGGLDIMKFKFRIERVENLGSYRLVYGTIGENKIISNLSARLVLKEGEEHEFCVRLNDIRYFDKNNGVRIKK
ncbi:MAG: ABC transporter ATP-binding protein [Nitrospirae bacterium]|nr:ABC transporter ATP-binding protein [Nitrospirota bacterium]